MVHGALSTAPVWVTRTNFARTGANEMTVSVPVPLPLATGWLQVDPSVETCT